MSRPHSSSVDLRDGLLICAAALLCYVLMLQDAFVNEDSRVFVNSVGLGRSPSLLHVGYSPLALGMAGLLAPLGVSVFHSLELLSALGTTVGLFFFHRSLLHLQPDRVRRNLGTALCALTPAVVFFATIVEIPGVFLGFIGVGWWLAARYLSRPSWGRAVAVGASTAVATMVHGSGHLLPGVMVAFLWTWPSRRRVPRIRAAFMVFAAHAAVFLALSVIFLGDAGRMGGAAGFFLGFGGPDVVFLFRTTAREWLLPFFPLSLLAIGSLFSWRSRIPSLAFNGLAAVYVFVSFVIISGMWERGTYALPLVFFAATLAARYWSERVLVVSLFLAACTAVLLVLDHDRTPPDLLPADAIVAIAREQNALFVVDGVQESDAVLRSAPHIPVVRVYQLFASPLPPDVLTADFDRFVALATANGDGVCLTQGAVQYLARYLQGFHRHIVDTYELREVVSGPLVAYRLARRE